MTSVGCFSSHDERQTMTFIKVKFSTIKNSQFWCPVSVLVAVTSRYITNVEYKEICNSYITLGTNNIL